MKEHHREKVDVHWSKEGGERVGVDKRKGGDMRPRRERGK